MQATVMTEPFTYVALSAMLTPALFMTATGSLIISTSNRMSRIVDRIRVQVDLADRLDRGLTDLDYPEDRRERVEAELRTLEWRSARVRAALSLLYVSLCAFVGSSLVLGFDVLTGHRIHGLPTVLALLGVGLMLAASVSLSREALRALRSSRAEVRFHRDLLARRRADRGAAG
jgi:hypothetical protein